MKSIRLPDTGYKPRVGSWQEAEAKNRKRGQEWDFHISKGSPILSSCDSESAREEIGTDKPGFRTPAVKIENS